MKMRTAACKEDRRNGLPLRRLAVAVAVAASPAVAAVAIVAPVAHASLADCPSGYLCVWNAINFPGSPNNKFFYDNSSWAGTQVQNSDYSWADKGTQYVRVYDYYNGPVTLCLTPGMGVFTNASAQHRGDGNKWSSSIPC